jgi:hypothetical protein
MGVVEAHVAASTIIKSESHADIRAMALLNLHVCEA